MMTMSKTEDKRLNEIIRVQKHENFTIIDNAILENPNLSWKAKGILLYIMSKPDGWKVVVGNLVNNSTDGKSAVYSGLKELFENGYYEKVPLRTDDGKHIDRWVSTVYEQPKAQVPENPETTPPSLFTEFQETDNQEIENQFIESQEHSNTNFNTNINKTESNNTHVSQVLSYPTEKQDEMDETERKIEAYTDLIKENIDYDDLAVSIPHDMGMVNEFIAIIIDVIMTPDKYVYIGGKEKPRALVKNYLLKLTYEDIEHTIDQFKSVKQRIRRKSSYILSMLYNCKLEMDSHFTNAEIADRYLVQFTT